MRGTKKEKLEKEKSDWDILYDYIKKEILNYDDNTKFPKYLIMRIQGLLEGKFYANKNTKPLGKYTYQMILMACKVCKPKIKDYLTRNSAKIKDEQHMCNIVMMFIEQEINDVAIRLKEKEKAEEILSEIELPEAVNVKSNYKATEHNENSKLNHLW